MRALLIGALLLSATPAFALTAAEEGAAIETACNKLGLGEEQCTCIAADAMAGLAPEMRAIVLLSLEDEVGFEIRVKSREFAAADIEALNDYQVYVQQKCAPGATGG